MLYEKYRPIIPLSNTINSNLCDSPMKDQNATIVTPGWIRNNPSSPVVSSLGALYLKSICSVQFRGPSDFPWPIATSSCSLSHQMFPWAPALPFWKWCSRLQTAIIMFWLMACHWFWAWPPEWGVGGGHSGYREKGWVASVRSPVCLPLGPPSLWFLTSCTVAQLAFSTAVDGH